VKFIIQLASFILSFSIIQLSATMPPRAATRAATRAPAPAGQAPVPQRELREFGDGFEGWYYWSLFQFWRVIQFLLRSFPFLDAAFEVTGRYALFYLCVLIIEYVAWKASIYYHESCFGWTNRWAHKSSFCEAAKYTYRTLSDNTSATVFSGYISTAIIEAALKALYDWWENTYYRQVVPRQQNQPRAARQPAPGPNQGAGLNQSPSDDGDDDNGDNPPGNHQPAPEPEPKPEPEPQPEPETTLFRRITRSLSRSVSPEPQPQQEQEAELEDPAAEEEEHQRRGGGGRVSPHC
jgi:hypothetical protein